MLAPVIRSTLALTSQPDPWPQEIPMSPSVNQIAALRRLTRVYRHILMLAVPAALAGCQDGVDPLAPESADAGGEVAAPAPEDVATLVAASTNRIAFASSSQPANSPD